MNLGLAHWTECWSVVPPLCLREKPMVILFQFALFALVLMSFVLVVYVPVAYASPQNWDQSKRLILFGSIIWGVLVVVVGSLNYFVV